MDKLTERGGPPIRRFLAVRAIQLLIEKLEVGAFAANCYLVGCPQTKKGIVIDPGGEGQYIVKRIRELGLDILYIINTHAHIDHIGANADIKEAFKAPILVHEVEASMYRSPQASLALFMEQSAPIPPDGTLRGGAILEAGTLSIKIIETPGHTAGSITLEINGVLFTGDTLFNFSIGRTDLPGGSYRRIIQSIQDKIMPYPDETKVFPGHGPATTVGEERRFNPFLS